MLLKFNQRCLKVHIAYYKLTLTSWCPHSKRVLVDGLDQVVGQVDRLQFSHPLKGEGLHGGYGIPGEVNVLQAGREGLLSQGSNVNKNYEL